MKWIRRYLDKHWSLHTKRSRRFAFRLLGRQRIPRHLWDFHFRSLRGGLCLGVFISLTPTIPFHMLLSTLGAIYFRVNLPVALAAVWITNPLTLYPIFRFAWKVGAAVHDRVPWIRNIAMIHSDSGRWTRFFSHTVSLWTGCLILACGATVLAWLLVTLFHNGLGRFPQALVRDHRRSGELMRDSSLPPSDIFPPPSSPDSPNEST